MPVTEAMRMSSASIRPGKAQSLCAKLVKLPITAPLVFHGGTWAPCNSRLPPSYNMECSTTARTTPAVFSGRRVRASPLRLILERVHLFFDNVGHFTQAGRTNSCGWLNDGVRTLR